ncbi:DegT/DnrJ/EryC1/StrS aminotransferase family protein [Luedemannella flava]|uniref:DegT/DnrJ/EryC1/StrS aminotransferase family protein n=2 Tax=Luedemannella flava TaxID=349316 RepID=A0ABP4XHT7_9ACTN
MSEQCRRFEAGFAARQGRRFAVFVDNGSVANLLLIQAMLNADRFRPGGKIGFSALTWPTNVMPLIQLGLTPVPLDCELATLNVSPRGLAPVLNDLSGLFLTNVLGFCDDLPRIRDDCAAAGVTLLEDNCESLGSVVDGRLLGNFGLAATFSFFVGHHMSTIEGGMVVTDDEELYEHLLIGRTHGWDRNLDASAAARLRAGHGVDDFYARYTFYELASNFRPTEIAGFLGNTQLPYWDEIVTRRADNFARFAAALADNDEVHRLDVGHMDLVSNFAMPVVCRDPGLAGRYRARFDGAGVEIRPVIAGNVTRQPFYRRHVSQPAACPNADLVHENGFYFGNNPELTDDELTLLCAQLRKPHG